LIIGIYFLTYLRAARTGRHKKHEFQNLDTKNTMDLFPGKACMTIHEPIDVRGYDMETIDKLISLTGKAILEGL